MGEIGIPRHEFLYDIRFWEARRIMQGYRRRNILTYQLLRLTAYSSFFSMRDNKRGLHPHDWLPLYFDEDERKESPLSDEDLAELQAEMDAINSRLSAATAATTPDVSPSGFPVGTPASRQSAEPRKPRQAECSTKAE